MSIEGIKKEIINRGYIGYEETLLSSLEKEEQAHTMSVYDLNMKNAEIGIALEKEKERYKTLKDETDKWGWELKAELEKERERGNQAEYFRNGMQTRVNELSVENESLQETIKFWKKSYNEEIAHSKQAEQKVKELDDRIVELVLLINGYAERIIKLTEAVKKHKSSYYTHIDKLDGLNDDELYRVLEEVKADPSIGKLEIVDGFDDNDWP